MPGGTENGGLKLLWVKTRKENMIILKMITKHSLLNEYFGIV